MSLIPFSVPNNWQPRTAVSQSLTAVVFGSQYFIAVGLNGFIARSANGINWVTMTSNTSQNLYQVAALNGVYGVVGAVGTVLKSTDTVQWNLFNTGVAQDLNGIAGGNAQWVAVGNNGSIFNSRDLQVWQSRTSGTSINLQDIAYGNSSWVAVGPSGTILRSVDTISWASQTSNTSQQLNAVAYGASIFIAVGNNGAIVKSSNGTSWAAITTAHTDNFKDVFYSNGIWLISGTSGKMLGSVDSIAWFTLYTNTNLNLTAAAEFNNIWVATGESGLILRAHLPIPDNANIYYPVKEYKTPEVGRKFIVRLRKDSPTGTIVSNSQVLSIDNIGNKTLLEQCFTNTQLFGSIVTNKKIAYNQKTIVDSYTATLPSEISAIVNQCYDDRTFIKIKGSTVGFVYGGGYRNSILTPYSEDSDYNTAAVHQGLVNPGERATIKRQFIQYYKNTGSSVGFNFIGSEANNILTYSRLEGCGFYFDPDSIVREPTQGYLYIEPMPGEAAFAYDPQLVIQEGRYFRLFLRAKGSYIEPGQAFSFDITGPGLTSTDLQEDKFGSLTLTEEVDNQDYYISTPAVIRVAWENGAPEGDEITTFKISSGVLKNIALDAIVKFRDTYSLIFPGDVNSVNEGSPFVFQVVTRTVPVGNVIYYTIQGIQSIDFTTNIGTYRNTSLTTTNTITGVKAEDYAKVVNLIYLRHLGRYPESVATVDSRVSLMINNTLTINQFNSDVLTSPESVSYQPGQPGALNSGTITVAGDITHTVIGVAVADSRLEGAEVGNIQLRLGSVTGEIIAYKEFTINDTSAEGIFFSAPPDPIHDGTSYTMSLIMIASKFPGQTVNIRAIAADSPFRTSNLPGIAFSADSFVIPSDGFAIFPFTITIPHYNSNNADYPAPYYFKLAAYLGTPGPSTLYSNTSNITNIPTPLINIQPETLPMLTAFQLYSQQLTATGGCAGPYTWSIVSGALPSGVTLNAGTGLIQGTYSPATFSLLRSAASVNEGDSFNIVLSTNAPGTFPYIITGVTSADIGGAALSGSMASGDRLTFTATSDGGSPEGPEIFTIQLLNNQASTTVTINDTSNQALIQETISFMQCIDHLATFVYDGAGNFRVQSRDLNNNIHSTRNDCSGLDQGDIVRYSFNPLGYSIASGSISMSGRAGSNTYTFNNLAVNASVGPTYIGVTDSGTGAAGYNFVLTITITPTWMMGLTTTTTVAGFNASTAISIFGEVSYPIYDPVLPEQTGILHNRLVMNSVTGVTRIRIFAKVDGGLSSTSGVTYDTMSGYSGEQLTFDSDAVPDESPQVVLSSLVNTTQGGVSIGRQIGFHNDEALFNQNQCVVGYRLYIYTTASPYPTAAFTSSSTSTPVIDYIRLGGSFVGGG